MGAYGSITKGYGGATIIRADIFTSARYQTLAHEIGHNLGTDHGDGSAAADSIEKGNVAWKFIHEYKTYTSVMHYRRANEISMAAFSSPDVTHPETGRKTGDATHDNKVH